MARVVRHSRRMSGVSGGRIVEVARKVDAQAERRIDTTGMIVSPGFVDIHTHSDFTLLLNTGAESFVRQGVTTELLGACGRTSAPSLSRTGYVGTGTVPSSTYPVRCVTFLGSDMIATSSPSFLRDCVEPGAPRGRTSLLSASNRWDVSSPCLSRGS